MQVDPSKSSAENLLALVNAQAVHKYSLGDFTTQNPVATTPGAGNGNNNTSLVIDANESRHLKGSVLLRYNRHTLAQNRPSAGTVIFTNNQDTHETIHAKIALKHFLLPEELVFDDAVTPPPGGYEATYTVNPIANSRFYPPGALAITVKNTDVFEGAHPSFLFDRTGTNGGREVYDLRSSGKTAAQLVPDAGNWANNLETDTENFIRMLNYIVGKPGLFRPEHFTFGEPQSVGFMDTYPAGGTNLHHTRMTFDPQPGCPLTEGGEFYYWRFMDNTIAGIPQEIKDDTSLNRGKRVYDRLKIPSDYVTWLAYNASFPARVYHTVATESKLFQPGTNVYFTLT